MGTALAPVAGSGASWPTCSCNVSNLKFLSFLSVFFILVTLAFSDILVLE